MRLDEIIAALPDVGLRVELIQEKAGDPDARWYVIIAEAEFGPGASRWDGWGPVVFDAMVMAVRRAGVDIGDVPSDDAAYLRGLAERLFYHGTPDHGTDGGDVDMLNEIAGRV